MVSDNLSWFFMNEHGRDRYLRDRVEEQAELTSRLVRSQSRDAKQLRERLDALSGDVETRLTALTHAFSAYVELDSIRQELAAFPDHAAARRHAQSDVATLLGRREPPERADVAEYWLVPAVAAVRPDGTVDPDRAGIARERDAQATGRFLLGIRTALGNAPTAAELQRVAAPTVVDGRPSWDNWQQLLWLAVIAGEVGESALADLHPVLQPILDATDDGFWAQTRAAGAVKPQSSGGQVRAQTEALTAAVDRALANADGVLPRTEPKYLYELVNAQVAEGDRDERNLLARAAQLREVISDPARATEPEPPQDVPGALPVTTILRECLYADQVDADVRRTLWTWLLPSLTRTAEAQRTAPPEPTRVAVSHQGLTVTATGVEDASALRARERKLAKGRELIGRKRWCTIGLVGSILLAVVCLVVGFEVDLVGWLVLLFGITAIVFGFARHRFGQRVREADGQLDLLRSRIEQATFEARSKDEHAAAEHEADSAAARELFARIEQLQQPVAVRG